ncbi:MAG TPA: type II toxin-antitoxin system RelE/ParE family toxin [Blastocatellia bacterium]|nr:type II toxin-antitoxin system RelE/ParE family toxin [Blastocatellia bacterium]
MKEFRLLVTDDAELDIAVVRDRYRAIGVELESAFRSSLDDAILAIRQRPLAFRLVHRSLRRVILRRFPYFLIFEIFDETVVVVACMHMRRDPKNWHARD